MNSFDLKPLSKQETVDVSELGAAPCACQSESAPQHFRLSHPLLLSLLLAGWIALYMNLPRLADVITFQFMGLAETSHFGQAVRFFIYDGPKVLMLLALVVFAVGIVRSFVTPALTRKILSGRGEFVGNGLAACLGIVTPFCSCSAVPLFIGFITTGIPLGVTLSFLIAAPMVNEIALVMLYGLFGFKVAALYLGTGLLVAIVAGWIIGRLRLEHHIEDWVSLATAEAEKNHNLTWRQRLDMGAESVRDIVGKVWLYVVIGIAIGAGIHGYVPEGFMASVMGSGAWWSVPAAVIMGVPLYTNAAGIIPIVSALFAKGAALGTTLAFMMSVIALSLPEMIILRKVLKPRLIAVFVGVVASGILLVGFVFNAVI
ncbi:permease [Desulfobaculum sp. SPO524]|uniref:permease n=1 Tax=Desulfobaculum sp. SPO524 TaxID=3378071 RepID=UPI003852193C